MSGTRLEKAKKILFTNATVVDPEKLTQKKAEVLVENGKLVDIGKIDSGGFNGKVFDVDGKVLCPGRLSHYDNEQ